MKEFARNFRLCTLSLIANIFEHYNDKYYEPLHSHLRMDNVDIYDPVELKKWMTVHELFNKDEYKVDFDKNVNANTIMNKMNHKELTKKQSEVLKKNDRKNRNKPTLSLEQKEKKENYWMKQICQK